MKKLISLTLAVMLIAVSAGYVFADVVYSRGVDARIKIKAYTGLATAQDASGTIVQGTNRILGYAISGSAASGGGLYDATSAAAVQNSGTGMISDAYCAAGAVTTIMFPMPYDAWTNTLYVLVLPATTSTLTIFYE